MSTENKIPGNENTLTDETSLLDTYDVAEKIVDTSTENTAQESLDVNEDLIDTTMQICKGVTVEEKYSAPLSGPLQQQVIYTMRFTGQEVEDKVNNSPAYNVIPNEHTVHWMRSMQQAVPNSFVKNQFSDLSTREGAEWRQSVDYENIKLRAGKPNLANSSGNSQVLGERAIVRIQQALGLGNYVQIPLWHSGIWVTFRVPSDIELLNLDAIIAEEKIRLGMETRGLVFSNYSAYLINHLINFALEHVYDCTIKEHNPALLRKLIRVSDIPLIAWGLACSIYPNGYPHSQPCMVNPEKCRHVTKEQLFLPKINWVDNTALTKAQRKHMANRVARYSEEEILAYQNQGRASDGKAFSIRGVNFALRVPSIDDYVNSGYQWINDIVSAVDSLFDKNIGETRKESMILGQANLSSLRQYAHWVKSITHGEGDGEVTLTDPADLNRLIEILCTDSEIVKGFMDAVAEYIQEATISLIAIPRTRCPSCQQPDKDDKEDLALMDEQHKHPYLVPLDAVNLFFTLRGYRTARAGMN